MICSEPGIPLGQLGQVLGHRILDASDQPLVDRDPDERRHERLRGGERRLQALASRAVEVALEDEAVVVDDEKASVSVSRRNSSSRSLTADDEVGLDAGRKGTRTSTRRYPPRREPVLVTHVRLAPDQRPSERRLVGRRPRPGVHAEHRRDQQRDDDARDQKPPTRAPRLARSSRRRANRPARPLGGGDTCRSPAAPSRRRRARRSRAARFR